MNVRYLAREINYQNLNEYDENKLVEELTKLQLQQKEDGKIDFKTNYWQYYLNTNNDRLDNIFGKFLLFYSWNLNVIKKEALIKLVILGLSPIIKFPSMPKRSSVICIYTIADKNEMKNIVKFMLDNDLLKKTKDESSYIDIAFKKEEQTKTDKYGEEFKADIKLSDFIDLKTGELL